MNIKNPMYIPKLINGTVVDFGIHFNSVMFDAHTVYRQKALTEKFRSSVDRIFINPATNRLSLSDTQQQKSFIDLPYYIAQDKVDDLFSDATFRLNSFVKPCVDYQIDNGADALITPYIHFEEVNSSRCSVNTSLIADTVRNLKTRSPQKPLFVGISVGCELFKDLSSVESVVDLYSDSSYIGDLAGFVVFLDGFDYKKIEEVYLKGLLHFVFQLSALDKEVHVAHVGHFGETLTAVGSAGFIAGVNQGESFALQSFNTDYKGRMGRGDDYTYIPEIFGYLNDADVVKVGYSCSCPTCGGKIPTGSQDKKKHFIHTKMAFMEEVSKKTISARKDYILNKLKAGKKLLDGYRNNYGVKEKSLHLDRLINALESFRGEYFTQDAVELNNLLENLDSKINA